MPTNALQVVRSLAPNGIPDFMEIGRRFPDSGNGHLTHQTQLGDLFTFHLVKDAGSRAYDVFIETAIDYRGRDNSGHATHRLAGSHGRPMKICFAEGKVPTDLRMAVVLTIIWSERTSQYIHNGLKFGG